MTSSRQNPGSDHAGKAHAIGPAKPQHRGALGILMLAASLFVPIAAIGAIGAGVGGYAALSVTVAGVVFLVPGALMIASAVGLARLARPLFREAACPFAIQIATGIALLLTLSHILGQLGLLHGDAGFAITGALTITGLTLLIHQLFPEWRSVRRASIGAPTPKTMATTAGAAVNILTLSTIAIALFAIANAPGVLWASEFGAYDALSYHLQLPQEWLANGRLTPLKHNIYSFLPGYVESAFLYLAALTNAPATGAPGASIGLLAGSGWRANACQGFHLLLWLMAAGLVGILAEQITRAFGASRNAPDAASRTHSTQPREFAADSPSSLSSTATTTPAPLFLPSPSHLSQLFAFLLFLLTPWPLVVGTLAYNEMGVLVLFAGALLVATDAKLPPRNKGLLAGALVAGACGSKLTAILFVGVPIAIVLLGLTRPRDWWRLILPGCLAALAFLAPWMVRNWQHAGNPLFPLALTGPLGTAHWDAAQVALFAREHASDLPFLKRLALLLLPDPTDPAATPGHPIHRGLSHPQWGCLSILILLSASHAIFWLRHELRRLAILLAFAVLSQGLLWLLFTHLQSRFLLPIIVPGLALVALAVSRPSALWRSQSASSATDSDHESESDPEAGFRARLAPISGRGMAVLCCIAIATQAFFLWRTVATERGGQPAALLTLQPRDFTGAALADVPAADREKFLAISPIASIAAEVPAGERVYLLGDATPFYYPPGVLYHTVWDRWLFKDDHLEPGPEGQPIRYALIDFASLARYERSGYLPPHVSVDKVRTWMLAKTRPIREWPDAGKVLVRVLP